MLMNGRSKTLLVMILCGSYFCFLSCGCDKPSVPKPDGSSGIRGVCVLTKEPSDEKGNLRNRTPWVGVEVVAERTNLTSKDPMFGIKYRAVADAAGKFDLALHPGTYMVSPHDYERLQGMVISPFIIDIELGRFTEFVLDYDKIVMKDVRDLKP